MGMHLGNSHLADLGDGDGRKVQQYLARQRLSRCALTRVVARLSTTSLGGWHHYFAASTLEELESTETDARAHQIH